jgi:glutathione synthase/RimK-type ligase-like ATP-grasp enzyme
MYDIVLLTEHRFTATEASPEDWYLQQILTEDRILAKALEGHGLRTIRKNWADPDFDWSSTRMALFRTTWDYFHRFPEFSQWLGRTSSQTMLLNPPPLVRWNMDKNYLPELAAKGICIPPTRIRKKGSAGSLTEWHHEAGWANVETVLKPTISGGARHTYRLNAENIERHESIFRELIVQEDMMLQEFQYCVPEKGEISLMVMGGQFTHAVQKTAKAGDFRVQDDFGGTVHHYHPTEAEISLAERAVAACNPAPLYARVDIVESNQGQLAIMELELIEPELWFRFHPPAAVCLADAIVAHLDKQ